jgi:Contractile injection system tube protein
MDRAAFLIRDPRRRSTTERISCLLNPSTLSFRRVAGLQLRRSLAGAVTQDGLRDDPLIQTGGGVTELRLDLLFDVDVPGTWLARPRNELAADGEDDRDVRDLTRPLWDLAENLVHPGAVAGPPRVDFFWGKRLQFPAVVAAVAERLERFTASGIPRRSFLRLRLLRADDEIVREELPPLELPGVTALTALIRPEPEPDSPLDVLPLAEQPPAETYESYVSPGHPMFLTAYFFFGDPSRWTAIAEANPDVDPVFVPPGTVLRIPTGGRQVSV